MDCSTHTAAQVVAELGLEPHIEGGFFREVYRSPLAVDVAPAVPQGRRSLATSILYLVAEGDPSRFHRLASDELWFFHAGAQLEMVFLYEGEQEARVMHLDAADPQVLVPAQVWVAARVTEPAGWCLAGCVVAPGFEYEDFERAEKHHLRRRFPYAEQLIEALG